MGLDHGYLVECDVETALREIGFKEDAFGCLEWRYQELSMMAGAWPGSEWELQVQRISTRTMTDFTCHLPARGIKGWYYAKIYELWRDEFILSEIPDALLPGQQFIEYQRVLRKLLPRAPSITIERPWMRLLVNQFRKLVDEVAGNPDVDFPILLWFSNDQLHISWYKHTFSVPASGAWIGQVTISGRSFFRATRRFNCDPVSISYADGHLDIVNHRISANWSDQDVLITG
jgi:hypothetical protein